MAHIVLLHPNTLEHENACYNPSRDIAFKNREAKT